MPDMIENKSDRSRSGSETSDTEFDHQYIPIVSLPEIVVSTNEENEEVVLVLKAKLYRFDRSDDVPEWKERGRGELKILKDNVNKTVRIVMRRDKTFIVCANHFITPLMELKPKPGQDKVLIYTTPADFTDHLIKAECLAVKFESVDLANEFKKVFKESQQYVLKECKLYNGAEQEEDSDEDTLTSSEDENGCENSEKLDDVKEKTERVIKKLSDLNVSK